MKNNNYHLFVVTYYKNKIKKTICVKARDKRMAKHAAKRKIGNEINIVTTLKWREHISRTTKKSPKTVLRSSNYYDLHQN